MLSTIQKSFKMQSFAYASLTAVPPLPPTNRQVSNISTRAATLTWQAPVVSFLNSLTAVSSYQVIAMQGQFPNVSDIHVDVDAAMTNYTFPHTLEEYTVYACTIISTECCPEDRISQGNSR